MHSQKLAVVQVEANFQSCQAIEDITAGSFLMDLWGEVIDSVTMYTVHVEKKKHLIAEGPLKYVNHSCDSNAKFVFEKRNVPYPSSANNHEVFWHMVATRDIKKGENVTYDYHTTEYEVAEHFKCKCGAEKCLGFIKGFKFLSPEEQKSRASDISPVLTELWNENF